MTLDPEVASVVLAVAAAGATTWISRRRRICATCGRPIDSVLCACRELQQRAVCAAHGLPACTQCGPPHVKS